MHSVPQILLISFPSPIFLAGGSGRCVLICLKFAQRFDCDPTAPFGLGGRAERLPV